MLSLKKAVSFDMKANDAARSKKEGNASSSRDGRGQVNTARETRGDSAERKGSDPGHHNSACYHEKTIMLISFVSILTTDIIIIHPPIYTQSYFL